ncbi:MAG: DUF3611 family protein [Pegethrix bostrychoides GSE-TBD4-15B]|jgi:hypothetical protein|uniref:DUF3611 family protein n=1 Tax=Pegethrix bostrychoides GSE-TBD4-15B TaxID=2839662 RepID=A0A951PD05_9CYAN|nr:DUF3611 family protein [Pegethrix bostrychoides GSE-TBD4-15B]
MANRIDSYSLPPALRRVVTAFRFGGWLSFWIQIVLAVVSAIVLLFAAGSFGASSTVPVQTIPGVPQAQVPSGSFNPGTGAGLFLAVLGLLVLFVGAYWAYRYTRIARKLRNAADRPKRGDVLRILYIGLGINLVGMLLTILGAQAIVGSLVAKSFAQGVGIFSGNFQRFINPLDIFVVQANTNTIMAHFIGLVSTLGILRTADRQ